MTQLPDIDMKRIQKKRIVLHQRRFKLFLTAGEIRKIVVSVASKINKDYRLKEPCLIPVLNGSFLFAADLVRELNIQAEVAFVKKSSYSGTRSAGKVRGLLGLNQDIRGRHVIVIEDIVDSGRTLVAVLKDLRRHHPASIRVAALLFKPGAYRQKEKIHYVGRRIPDDFVVGYGLDFDGLGRNLRSIYMLDLRK